MNIANILRKGIRIKSQKPGYPEDGPITPSLKVLSALIPSKESRSDLAADYKTTSPVSLIGFELARMFMARKVRVIFMNTGGSGIAPWRGLIVLGSDFQGQGQIMSPAAVAKVAHELIHVLQREMNQPHYWPSGSLRPRIGGRWIGDSTNYMELIAYLVSFTVEYDLTAAKFPAGNETSHQQAEIETRPGTIRDLLATMTENSPQNAGKLLLKLFPNNPIYRTNQKLEEHFPDRRIPPGSWHYWLRHLGFSRQAVDHIMVLAAQGNAEWLDE